MWPAPCPPAHDSSSVTARPGPRPGLALPAPLVGGRRGFDQQGRRFFIADGLAQCQPRRSTTASRRVLSPAALSPWFPEPLVRSGHAGPPRVPPPAGWPIAINGVFWAATGSARPAEQLCPPPQKVGIHPRCRIFDPWQPTTAPYVYISIHLPTVAGPTSS